METSSAETGSSSTISSGFRREGPGDRDALSLAARELVGVARHVVAPQPDQVHQLGDAGGPLLRRCRCRG